MNHSAFDVFPALFTKRLHLKELTTPNLDHMLEITSFNGRANNHEEVRALIASVKEGFSNKQMITWGMFYNEELIGTIGFYRGFENDSGEVGYVTREPFRRKGFLFEAMTCILNFGFDRLNLKQITAYTTDQNIPSIGVLEKFGFQKTDLFSDSYRRYELSKNSCL